MYDYIIIGGGVAGLYANYMLSKKKLSGILLEKEDYLGGRVLETEFHGEMVKLGASIIGIDNKNILKLLKKFKIKPKLYDGLDKTLLEPFDMHGAIKLIKTKFNKVKDIITNMTTQQFLNKYFDKDFVKKFIINCEYQDFLESDVSNFIKYYKIDDMDFIPYKYYMIEWKQLIDKMIAPNCYSNHGVVKIKKEGDAFKVYTMDNMYETKKVIMALTLKPLNMFMKQLKLSWKYSDYIGTVPFSKIYVHYNINEMKLNYNNMGTITAIPNQLDKITPAGNNILMAAYNDNMNVKWTRKLLKLTKKEQIRNVESKLEPYTKQLDMVPKGGKIDDILIHIWEEGVHFFRPYGKMSLSEILKKLSRPMKNVYVVGEIVSKKQGYVEGAIESVKRTLL